MARWRKGNPSVPDPFGCRCLTRRRMLRFHTALVKPDMRISRIRLSSKDSRVRPRIDAGSPLDPDQTQVLVQDPVGETCKPLSPYLVLCPQPLTKPVLGVGIHAPVGLAHRTETEVVGPTRQQAVDPTDLRCGVEEHPSAAGQLTDLPADPLDTLPRGACADVGATRSR